MNKKIKITKDNNKGVNEFEIKINFTQMQGVDDAYDKTNSMEYF